MTSSCATFVAPSHVMLRKKTSLSDSARLSYLRSSIRRNATRVAIAPHHSLPPALSPCAQQCSSPPPPPSSKPPSSQSRSSPTGSSSSSSPPLRPLSTQPVSSTPSATVPTSPASNVSPPTPVPARPTVATSAAAAAAASVPPVQLLAHIASLTARVRGVKCPFWRRRFTDALEASRDVLIWAIRTRHKSLPLPPELFSPSPPPTSASGSAFEHDAIEEMAGTTTTATKSAVTGGVTTSKKRKGLSISERVAIIRDDFIVRQYYVTGRLSTALYRDDCLFDGPDPDGRVRGTRKFCDAASGLFDSRSSRVELIDVYASRTGKRNDALSPAEYRDSNSAERASARARAGDDSISSIGSSSGINSDSGGRRSSGSNFQYVVAEWRLEGVLKLPWRPAIKPYTGATVYRFDDDGLVCEHVESWSVNVVDAFVSVVVKGFGVPPARSASELRLDKIRDGSLQWSVNVDKKTGLLKTDEHRDA